MDLRWRTPLLEHRRESALADPLSMSAGPRPVPAHVLTFARKGRSKQESRKSELPMIHLHKRQPGDNPA